MFFLVVVEFVFWSLLLVFGVTQVLWPLIQKRPLFPLFRARSAALKGEIVELEEQIREERLADEADNLKQRLEALRNAPETLDKTKQ